MNYLVCLKQVPNTKNIEADEQTGSLKRETCGSKLNDNDEFAISCLLEIDKLKNGKKSALTLGPKSSKACLRRALSFGIENAYHLTDKAFVGSDVYATAYALSQAVKKLNGFDLIITGQQTSDGDTGQVPSEIAKLLDYNFCCCVSNVHEVNDEYIIVSQDDGFNTYKIKINLPAVISIKENSYKKSESTFKEKILAQKKEIIELTINDLIDNDKNNYGYFGSKTKVKNMFLPVSKKETKIVKNPNLERDIKLLLNQANKELTNNLSKLENISNKLTKNLIVLEDNNVTTLFEMITKIQSLYNVYEIDVLSININEDIKNEIINKKVVDNIFNFKSKTNSYISYKDALEKIDLEKYDNIFSPSSIKGRSYLPYIAAKMKAAITADCLDFEIDDKGNLLQIRPAFSDRLYAKIQKLETSKILFSTYRENVFKNNVKESDKITKYNSYDLNIDNNYEILSENKNIIKNKENKDVVFIVGNSIQKEDIKIIEKEAKKYDAEIYCTRPLVIGNLFPSSKQVGISGLSLNAKVAVLIGVSGSLQTLAGLQNVSKILFINTDINANICQNADIGYIKDWKKIIGV